METRRNVSTEKVEAK
jgi:hypothetical protein